MNRFIISYEELLVLIRGGIMRRTVKGTSLRSIEGLPRVKGAFAEGIYGGCPGKEINAMLPDFDDEQMKEIAKELAQNFFIEPPDNHVTAAVLIRYIYGQFAKNGIHRSKEDFERMKKEELNWILPRKLLKFVYKEFENVNNFYGLSILCEMEGHRLGDEAVINDDSQKVEEMEDMYLKSVLFAHECGSFKQMFTPYYWAAIYFIKLKDKKKAIKYSKLTIENAEKYCPDDRGSYQDKLKACLKYLKKKDKSNWIDFYNKHKKNAKNKCVKSSIKSIKKK